MGCPRKARSWLYPGEECLESRIFRVLRIKNCRKTISPRVVWFTQDQKTTKRHATCLHAKEKPKPGPVCEYSVKPESELKLLKLTKENFEELSKVIRENSNLFFKKDTKKSDNHMDTFIEKTLAMIRIVMGWNLSWKHCPLSEDRQQTGLELIQIWLLGNSSIYC